MTTNLKTIPYGIRENLLLVLKAKDNDGAKVNTLEKNLVRYSVKTHTKFANKAIVAALKVVNKGNQSAKVTQAQANIMVSATEKAFKGIAKTMKARWETDIEKIYTVNKSGFVRRFKVDPKTKKVEFHTGNAKNVVKSKNIKHVRLKQASFGDVDKQIWDHLSALSLLSIGDHFPTELKPAVTKAIQTGVIARGLNKEQAGKFLQRELTKILGSTNQAVPPKIIQQGLDRSAGYFKGLASTNVNFARNFGQITAMEEAEIERYEIVAIMDNLTSQICQQLNGRVFSITVGAEHRNKVLQLESVEELKEFAPWRKDLSEFNLKEGQKLQDNRAAEALAQAGLSMPPYHFRCRTEVHPA